MSYNLTPITAKIQKTTKGGITQPLLNVGGPVKMKASTPAKQTKGEYTNISFADYRKSGLMKPEEAKFYKGSGSKKVKTSDLPAPPKPKEKKKSEYTNLTFAEYRKSGLMKPEEAKFYTGAGTKRVKTSGTTTASATTKKSGFAGDTPYTVSNGKGTIHGPKSSYDDAYKKRNKKVYGEMSKSQFIKESKRQTKVFKETGKWDAPKAKRTKAVTVSAITPTSVKPTKTVSIEAKINPAELKPKVTKVNTKKADPSKREVRKTRKINKKLTQAAEARAGGNEKKALRKEKAAMRKAARLAKKNK